ncbi:MAG TPA: hypothetical protein VHM27_12355, partial [Rhizomicrobium sp.]|nr:hypothetical protein [Rhizomicrobium sp.]
YDLPLAIRPPPLNDTVHGVLTVRSHGCGKPERIERFDVTIEQDEYKDLATTMAVMDCTEAGAPCATPPAGRKGRLRLGGGRLFFGSQALARAP